MARTVEQLAQAVNALVAEVNAIKTDSAAHVVTVNAIITAAATNLAAIAAVTPTPAVTQKGVTQKYQQ